MAACSGDPFPSVLKMVDYRHVAMPIWHFCVCWGSPVEPSPHSQMPFLIDVILLSSSDSCVTDHIN